LFKCARKETFHWYLCRILPDSWLVRSSKVKVSPSMEQRWSVLWLMLMCPNWLPSLELVTVQATTVCAVDHTVQGSFTCFHLRKYLLWVVNKLQKCLASSNTRIKETQKLFRNSRMV
jgi:hypothetical protein